VYQTTQRHKDGDLSLGGERGCSWGEVVEKRKGDDQPGDYNGMGSKQKGRSTKNGFRGGHEARAASTSSGLGTKPPKKSEKGQELKIPPRGWSAPLALRKAGYPPCFEMAAGGGDKKKESKA